MSREIDALTGESFDPKELPLQVCRSPAGFYIGKLSPSGVLYCRLSCFFETLGAAVDALINDEWIFRAGEDVEIKKLQIAEVHLNPDEIVTNPIKRWVDADTERVLPLHCRHGNYYECTSCDHIVFSEVDLDD